MVATLLYSFGWEEYTAVVPKEFFKDSYELRERGSSVAFKAACLLLGFGAICGVFQILFTLFPPVEGFMKSVGAMTRQMREDGDFYR
ncbi:MAG: hypothetical protein NTW61_09265 [Candidatus Melainabacteria bacterium]|nr:hypothetical protein [Candidatus Melainabacteria bacterium]